MFTTKKPDTVDVAEKAERERQADIDRVRSTAANPSASRVGTSNTHIVPSSEDRPEGELGLADISIKTIEGARAVLTLGPSSTGLLSQDDLLTIKKTIEKAAQETY